MTLKNADGRAAIITIFTSPTLYFLTQLLTKYNRLDIGMYKKTSQIYNHLK